MRTNAPIAIFAFKRPIHIGLALRSLLKNPEIFTSPIYIFCDGPRDETDKPDVEAARAVVRELAPPHATILERTENLGLDRSIVQGVTELCQRHGQVIVIEDDLEVSQDFLKFMNAALSRYKNDSSVMQISGYQFSVDIPGQSEGIFLPFTTSWGWATWSRAWAAFDHSAPSYAKLKADRAMRSAFDLHNSFPFFKMLSRNVSKSVPAWDIVFYSNVFERSGLVLYPRTSRVRNNGFDGSGTTCGRFATKPVDLNLLGNEIFLPERIQVDERALFDIRSHLYRESRVPVKILRRIQARLT